jgi:hypothetical protein
MMSNVGFVESRMLDVSGGCAKRCSVGSTCQGVVYLRSLMSRKRGKWNAGC